MINHQDRENIEGFEKISNVILNKVGPFFIGKDIDVNYDGFPSEPVDIIYEGRDGNSGLFRIKMSSGYNIDCYVEIKNKELSFERFNIYKNSSNPGNKTNPLNFFDPNSFDKDSDKKEEIKKTGFLNILQQF